MLVLNDVKKIIHLKNISRLDRLLPLFASNPEKPLRLAQIKALGKKAGLPKLAKLNISDILGKSHGLVILTSEGWEIQQDGLKRVQTLAKTADINSVVSNSSQSLRNQANGISDTLTKDFVMEAIHCFEAKQYRAAVVFSWAGAIALLYQYVFNKKLTAFNSEALRRNSRWKQAKQQDDLARIKEHDFLDVCEAIGLIGKNVKLMLQNECLMLRNTCGHPNTASIGEHSVAAHIEKLIKNVFSRF